jgi:hypothetical protein
MAEPLKAAGKNETDLSGQERRLCGNDLRVWKVVLSPKHFLSPAEANNFLRAVMGGDRFMGYGMFKKRSPRECK